MTVPIGRPAAERPCRGRACGAVDERSRAIGVLSRPRRARPSAPRLRRGDRSAHSRQHSATLLSVTSVPLWQASQSAGRGDDTESDTGPMVGIATQMIAKASTWNDPASMKTTP